MVLGLVFIGLVFGLAIWFLRMFGIIGPVRVTITSMGPFSLVGREVFGPTMELWAAARALQKEVFETVGVVSTACFIVYYQFDENGNASKALAGCIVRPSDVDFIQLAPHPLPVHEAPQGLFFQTRLAGRFPILEHALWEIPFFGARYVRRCRQALIEQAKASGYIPLPLIEVLNDDGSLLIAMSRYEDRPDPSQIEITWEELEAAYGGNVPPIEVFERIDPKTLPIIERLYFRFFQKK